MARIGLVAHDDKKDELVAWALASTSQPAEQRLFQRRMDGLVP